MYLLLFSILLGHKLYNLTECNVYYNYYILATFGEKKVFSHNLNKTLFKKIQLNNKYNAYLWIF